MITSEACVPLDTPPTRVELHGSRRAWVLGDVGERVTHWAALLVVASGLLTPAVAVGQERPESVTVSLRVFDKADREPLDSVVVLVPQLDVRLFSDSSGHVLFEDIGVGTYDMILKRRGYGEERGKFTIDTDGSFQIGLSVLVGVRVVGTVRARENGTPLSGAIVRIEGVVPLLTDGEGRFVAEAVLPGRHAVEVEYLGRVPSVGTLVLEDTELASVDIRLAARAIELAGLDVVVEPRTLGLESAGFYDRRDRWELSGTRFTRQDIEQALATRVTDLLSRVPSAWIMASTSTPGAAIMRINRPGDSFGFSPSSIPGCEPTVYVDDLVYHDAFGPVRVGDLNFLPLDIIEGIEVYTGLTAPARFDAKGCGVILIWTRGYR